MPYLYLLILILIAAAIISFALSVLGVLVIGTLKLLPIVFIVLVIGVAIGRLKITVVHGRRRDDNR